MATRHEQTAEYIRQLVGAVNPYARDQANRRQEYYLYQMGYLSSYLASLAEEDPFILRRFKQHVEEQQVAQRRLR